ncbi:(4Fe-4S)-binding protein [candidate division WOR-3 bacterium RBG_13_43_14]|uniref:(4Fe-4S)-binding protein n=1 Tax=candidate division WOR-3 bacterium RBG_13_43_14 TaxID=1802590 RepID=A0A1F4UAA1_UNCW3|nr:MAG: (4Fe-4S)-binding protein [candidate division WOR-3 bacterium RBG_13_43_14]
MKQIVIISGKGGTGKTILTGSFAALAQNKVMVDCDVDAADLHLLLHPEIVEEHDFYSLPKAHIDEEKCTGCGECEKACHYEAVLISAAMCSKLNKSNGKNGEPCREINKIACEGCGICARICPTGAICMIENIAGKWFISETKYGPMVHARLGIAEENSGKLVSLVRQQARKIAEERSLDYVIIDGSPGIGCPVIASLTGADLALIITEPTLSGIHDLKRVIDLTRHFNINTACIINKHDLNKENTDNIKIWCRQNGIPIKGLIAFDQSVPESIIAGKPLVEYTDNMITEELRKIWATLS